MVVNIDKFIDENEAGTLAGGFAVGPTSWSPEIVVDVSGPPTAGTLPASQIVTLDHADGVTSGVKFEFTVPENYDSGPLNLQIVYAMSTAVGSPLNVIGLSVGAEIADVSAGTIDTATYAPSPISLTTPNASTAVTRSVSVLTIVEGDFDSGDRIVFVVERLGASGSDTHTGVWKVLDYVVVYDGQIAANSAVHQVEVFKDAAGTPAVPGTKNSFTTLDFQEGFTHSQKFQFTIPDNWDGASDFSVRFTYAMSGAGGGVVRLDISGQAASVITGSVATLAPAVHLVTTSLDTNVHRTTVAYSISGIGRAPGDMIVVTITRPSGDALDTHVSNWQLIGASVFTGQGGNTPVGTEIDQHYLAVRDFRIVSVSGVSADTESADWAGDFEIWHKIESSVAAGRANVEWQGRLRGSQTKVASIDIPVKGQNGGPTPEYQIKVYAEGTVGAVYTGPLVAETTGVRTLVSLTDGDLSAQPTGARRFSIVVEATLDAGEILRVGAPFVRQE